MFGSPLCGSVDRIKGSGDRAAWKTAHFGKWHLGGTSDSPVPKAYGLDASATFNSANNPDAPPLDPTCPSPRAPPPQCNNSYWDATSTGLIVNYTIDFVREAVKEQKPFYVNAWLHMSHATLNPSPDQLAKFDPAQVCRLPADNQTVCPQLIMAASQTSADSDIDRLLHELDAMGVLNDTLIIFSTDNGPEDPHVFVNGAATQGPFRGRKRSLYEGGIRLPLIARWPGRIREGAVDASQMAGVDWLPTAASIAGVPLPAEVLASLDGEDRSAVLLRQGDDTKPMPRNNSILNEWRYGVSGHCWNVSPRLSVKHELYKLLANPPTGLWAGGALAQALGLELERCQGTVGSDDDECTGTIEALANATVRLELYELGPNVPGGGGSRDMPPEMQNLALDPDMKSTVEAMLAEALRWFATLPGGPSSQSADCNAFPFPRQSAGGAASSGTSPWKNEAGESGDEDEDGLPSWIHALPPAAASRVRADATHIGGGAWPPVSEPFQPLTPEEYLDLEGVYTWYN